MQGLKTSGYVKFSDEIYLERIGTYLQYNIVVSKDPCINEKSLSKVYSLLVVMTTQERKCENIFVYDISRIEETAVKIMHTLSENSVTPCTVLEILDELL